MWGSLATQFELEAGQIVGVKNARVSEFNGKSLNCGDDHCEVIFSP